MYDTAESEYNAKKLAADQQVGLGAVQSAQAMPRRSTPCEEAQKEVYYMQEALQKKQQAIAFLTANPAFDEFIMLIRKGVIGI